MVIEEVPTVITETPDYDPQNPDHVARWIAAGRPNLEEVDNLGNKWGPTIPYDLQPDGSYLVRPAPQQSPVTDVERMAALFTQARQGAPLYLDALKGRVWVALVEGGMSQADATAAGVALVLRFGAQLAAFNNAGGHPAAALALYQAISSAESVAALPWLTAPILAIFQGALAPS